MSQIINPEGRKEGGAERGTFPLILISLRFGIILVIKFEEHCQIVQSPGGQ